MCDQRLAVLLASICVQLSSSAPPVHGAPPAPAQASGKSASDSASASSSSTTTTASASTASSSSAAAASTPDPVTITFPQSFAFGTATAAYQIEGGWQEGGRGPSIWDAFSHTPGKIRTGETGDVAADHFHRFRSDVRLMAQMKLKYYRFSISWSRILPLGYGSVNEEGVKFYSSLIDELIANGIHPVATLYHWDLPLALQMEHDGWLSEATASAFVQYAAFCFSRFGDRVKHWITFNEPANHVVYGFARGEHAPGRSRKQTREPYIAAHFILLAHAYAVARYRSEFQPRQRGLISMALNSDWREPASDAPADVAAAQRSMEFNLGWFADPLYLGDYPPSMRTRIGNRLPAFTAEQQGLLLNSTDFFALQHYSTLMVSMRPDGELDASSFYADEGVRHHPTPGCRKNVLGWDIAPFGFHRLLKWVHQRYQPSGGIVITENGMPLREESAEAARHDLARVCYLKQYLAQLARAMREGVDVRGYFVWTLLDNFEWAQGTAPRFGLLYVDFGTQRRTAKGSAAFYKALSETHSFTLQPNECNATASVHPTFVGEAAALQRLVNRSTEQRQQSGQPTPIGTRREIVSRAVRLAGLAEVQARHTAELGEFRSMRTWQGKAEKMRGFAERMRAQLARSAQQAQRGARQQQQQQQGQGQMQGQGQGQPQQRGQPPSPQSPEAGPRAVSGSEPGMPAPGNDAAAVPPPLSEGGDADAAFPLGATTALDLPEVRTTQDVEDGTMVQTAIVDAAPVDQEELV